MAEHHRDKKYTGPKEIGVTMTNDAVKAFAEAYKDACFMGNGVVMFDGVKYRHVTAEEMRGE